MEKIINELKKEILGKDLTLLELDNIIQRITNSTTSLFNYEYNDIKYGCSYYIKYNNEIDMSEEILVEYDIINKNEKIEKTIVKITNVSKL